MKIQSKVLLLKNRAENQTACTAVMSGGIFYWRPIVSAEAINSALENESYQVIVLDHRTGGSDKIAAINSLRKLQPNARVILVSDPLELNDVVQAMRIGVREVFPPPLDTAGLIKCVEANLEMDFADAEQDRWSVLLEFLDSDETEDPPAPKQPAGKRKHTAPAATEDVANTDDAARARRQLDDLTAECKRLRQDVARLSAVEEHAVSLEKELEAARRAGPQTSEPGKPSGRGGTQKADTRVTELTNALAAEQAIVATLRTELNDQSKQKSSLEVALEEARKALGAAEKRASEAPGGDRDGAKKHAEDRRAHATREVAKLTQEKATLLAELARVQDEEEARALELEEANKRIGELELRIQDLDTKALKLTETEAALDGSRLELKRLEKELQAAAQARTELATQLEQQQARVAELSRDLDVAKTEVAAATAKLEAETGRIDKERTALATREQALAEASEQQRKAHEQADQELSQREASLTKQAAELRSNTAKLEAGQQSLQAALAEHESREARLAELENGIAADRRVLDEELASLAHQESEYKTRLTSLEEGERKLAESRAALSADQEALEQQAATVKSDAEAVAVERSSLQKIRETLNAERAKLDTATKDLESTRKDLEERISRFEQKREEIADEMKRFLAVC